MADKELRKDYKKVEDITSENCPSDVQAACKGFYSEQTISAVEIIEKARSQDSSTPSKSKEMSDSILACFIFEVGGSYMPVGGLSAKLGLGNETKRNECDLRVPQKCGELYTECRSNMKSRNSWCNIRSNLSQ